MGKNIIHSIYQEYCDSMEEGRETRLAGEEMEKGIRGLCDEETAKKTIEKAFLKHGVSYLIKVDKVREMKIGHFECKVKYSFYVNRFQREDAKVAIGEEHLDESTIIML